MIWENIKIALTSMVHNKLRTLLSLLGIIIGVASVVAILNLGQSVTESITESMNVGGIDMVNIFPSGSSRELNVFDESFGDTLMANVDGIEAVLPTASSSSRVRSGQDILAVTINGVTSDFFNVNNAELLYGEYFTALDNINRRQVVVLGKDVADELFPVGNAVGSYVSIFRQSSKRYLVVGVLDEKEATLGNSFDSTIFMPLNTYDQRFRSVRTMSSYTCKVAEGYDAITVGDSIEDYLTELIGSDYFTVFSAASIVEMAGEVTSTLSSFLAAIAAISLLVGGIGIMKKALGASPRVIMWQFLIEALTLTVIGGLIGILIGSLISFAIVNLVGWKLYFSYAAIVISLGFSMFVGVFFGWYPAAKASRLDPIESLSYE